MSTTTRCGGSRLTTYTDSGGAHTTFCPGCEDCRDRKDVPDPTATRAGETETQSQDDDWPRKAPPLAPLSPVEALARRNDLFGGQLANDAAAMLRALDRECDRLRGALADCRLVAKLSAPSHAESQHNLGIVVGHVTATLATDARTVDRG